MPRPASGDTASTYTCPPAGSYADLNGATGSASTSYTATNVTGQTCFEAQGYLERPVRNPVQHRWAYARRRDEQGGVVCHLHSGSRTDLHGRSVGLPECPCGGCYGSGDRNGGTANDLSGGQACAAGTDW